MANEPEEPRLDSEEEGGPVKSFVEHLEDLRWALVRCAVAIGITMLLCLIGGNYLVAFIKWPLSRTSLSDEGTNQHVTFRLGTNQLGTFDLGTSQLGTLDLGTNRDVTLDLVPVALGTNQFLAFQISPNHRVVPKTLADKMELVNLNPAGGFFVAFQVAIYGGLLLSAPFVLYYMGQFILPALRFSEKKYLLRGFAIGTFLFTAGVCFCYVILMPMALRASVKYSEWLGFSANQWRAEEYISFVAKFLLGMGLGFQLPLVVLTLVRIGILDYRQLAGFRRYMIVICLVLGAVLTTPEVLTQVMMAGPLYLLYEISVWIAWYWERRDRKRASALTLSGD